MKARMQNGGRRLSVRAQNMGSYDPTSRAVGSAHNKSKDGLEGVRRCELSGTRVRVKSSHHRGPSVGVIIGTYMVAGGYWVSIPSLHLHTVLRPHEWETL